MTTLLNVSAADWLLSALDVHVRASGKAPAGKGQDDAPAAEPAGPGQDADPEADPEELKEQILDAVRSALDWDGEGGDPEESKAALEDALADMFDADVEIVWDGESQLTLQVEGEDPVPLTADYLGELLEELAKHGSDAEPDPDARGYEVVWRRSGKIDKDKHLHAPEGVGGGQFVSKGAAVGGAVSKVAKTTGKAAGGKGGGGSGGGPKASALAKRAAGRSGPRATAKAVGGTLSAGTGSRVKVSGDKDGTFKVGSKKKKMSGKAVAGLMIAGWLAFGVAGGFLAATLGLPLGFGVAAATVATLALLKAIR